MAKRKTKNSRKIGKVAELEGADRLNAIFGTEFYRSQQRKGATDSPDLIDDNHPELAPEVKRRAFSKELHAAVEKARAEAEDVASAFVIHRGPGERWLFTCDLFEIRLIATRLARLAHAGVNCSECRGKGFYSGTDADCLNCSGTGIDPEDAISEWFNCAEDLAIHLREKIEAGGVDGKKIERAERRAKKSAER